MSTPDENWIKLVMRQTNEGTEALEEWEVISVEELSMLQEGLDTPCRVPLWIISCLFSPADDLCSVSLSSGSLSFRDTK